MQSSGAVLVVDVRGALPGRGSGGSALVAEGFFGGVDLIPCTSGHLSRVPTRHRDRVLDRGRVLVAGVLGVLAGFVVGPLLALGVGGIHEDLLSLHVDILSVAESQGVGLFLLEDNKAEALAPLHITVDHHCLSDLPYMLEGVGKLALGDLAVGGQASYEDLEAFILVEVLPALVVHLTYVELGSPYDVGLLEEGGVVLAKFDSRRHFPRVSMAVLLLVVVVQKEIKNMPVLLKVLPYGFLSFLGRYIFNGNSCT